MAEFVGQDALARDAEHFRLALQRVPQEYDRSGTAAAGSPEYRMVHVVPNVVDGEVTGLFVLGVDGAARVEAERAARENDAEAAVLRERQVIAADLHGEAGDIDLVAGVERVVRQAAGTLGFDPAVRWEQSTRAVPAAIAADVLAVLTEALSNAARHGRPSRVDVVLAADSDGVRLRVTDDGRGIGAATRVSGLANLAARAERSCGSCAWRSRQPSGTVVEWSAPLPKSSPDMTRAAGSAKGSRSDVNI
jgi:signal transduction histidine kinase